MDQGKNEPGGLEISFKKKKEKRSQGDYVIRGC